MHRAISIGFRVTKPWGDSDPFDFVVCHEKLLSCVQVKSVWAKRAGHCVNNSGIDNNPYTVNETDFLVAYLGPEDLWYILFWTKVKGRSASGREELRWKVTEFQKYIEPWGQFRGEEPPEPEARKFRRPPRRKPAAPGPGSLEPKSWKPGRSWNSAALT